MRVFVLCRHLSKLQRLLESDDVNMRIAAGETIALLFELARDIDPVSSRFGKEMRQTGIFFFFTIPDLNTNLKLNLPVRSLSSTAGMNCVRNWQRWPQTATNTEPRLIRGSSALCSGTCSRPSRWVSLLAWIYRFLSSTFNGLQSSVAFVFLPGGGFPNWDHSLWNGTRNNRQLGQEEDLWCFQRVCGLWDELPPTGKHLPQPVHGF